MTLFPWEYLWLPFSRANFPDVYDASWIASLVLLVALVILYNVRTRALHRHRLYSDMWEWLLWTGLITFLLVGLGALFSFDFAIVLTAEVVGIGVLVWARFRRFPPLFAAYEQQLARQRYLQSRKTVKPEATIRTRASRRRRRR